MKSKKIIKMGLVFLSCGTLLVGCSDAEETTGNAPAEEAVVDSYADATQIVLADDGITVDGDAVSTEDTAAVYTANDIVYYEEGQDFTYGDGSEEDEHSKEEADAHTVVHITEPGSYLISGTLSAGQIAVDLGKDAKEDPEAVVTLILDNADITCSVAPAVIFYDVYECGTTDEEQATKDVDTTEAGANVIIADGSVNNISGSYVAKIYEAIELNEDETEVVDSKTLHKYDGAFYSKMSMNVDGGSVGTGQLNITAENEGLDSELHLTINGGNINITSGNDGINTNEDGISVATINGGNLNIVVDGATGEGDGIDSNGWLVINGGTITASACAVSQDAGIDSDMGIYINGGEVIASGNMLDVISESEQNYMVLNFANTQTGGSTYTIKNEAEDVVTECAPVNDFTYLIVSDEALAEGTYSVWMGDTQLAGAASANGMAVPGMGGMTNGAPSFDGTEMPEEMSKPEGENETRPEEMSKPEGAPSFDGTEMPEEMSKPEGAPSFDSTEMPEEMSKPEGAPSFDSTEMPEEMSKPEGENEERSEGDRGRGGVASDAELTTEFVVTAGGTYYRNVSVAETPDADTTEAV